jgi:hypothetical protein
MTTAAAARCTVGKGLVDAREREISAGGIKVPDEWRSSFSGAVAAFCGPERRRY